MLTPKLNNCVDCNSIPSLLCKIDDKLTELSKDQYNNIIFELNRKINSTPIFDLLNYKRILTFRICNPEYAGCASVEQIASKVRLLTHK
jgi:hypothetical protein